MMYIRSVFFIILSVGLAHSQRSFIDNLVKNSGFEEYHSCPTRLGSFDKDVRYWNSPTLGSTDYFSGCSEVMTVPRNYNGRQDARNGRAYAGMYFLAPDNYREYIQVGLRKKLIRDSVYQLKLSVSLAESSKTAVGRMGFLFTSSQLRVPIKTVLDTERMDSLKNLKARLNEVNIPALSKESTEWQEVELYYRADGFERYLIIGNFQNDSLTPVYSHAEGWKPGAYYYVDRFMLFKVKSDLAPPRYKLDSIYVFKDIHFDFDRYDLDQMGRKDVQIMSEYLRLRPDIHIHISGHTDNLGTDLYNRQLSERRARTIAEGLVRYGIDSNRVHVRSFGSRRPVATNTSDRGRKRNRRAEFILIREDRTPED